MKTFKELFIDTGLIQGKVTSWCFGKDPVTEPYQTALAAGGNKYSLTASISFKSKSSVSQNKIGNYKIVFCAKLRSKIYRQDQNNESRWYIWETFGDSGCVVVAPSLFEEKTGINVYELAKTREFIDLQQKFKKCLKNGIKQAETLKKTLSEKEKPVYDTYLKSLNEVSEIIYRAPKFMEKTYILTNYDKFIREVLDKGYGKELKQRSKALSDYNTEIGKRFVGKVSDNELKAKERERLRKTLDNEDI